MRTKLQISAYFDQPALLQNLVEKLAYRHTDLGYGTEKMPIGFEALETSTTEAYVTGTLAIDLSGMDAIQMPFTSRFLFTCIKGDQEPYQLCWASSLS